MKKLLLVLVLGVGAWPTETKSLPLKFINDPELMDTTYIPPKPPVWLKTSIARCPEGYYRNRY
jgi:hypothetical protein